MYPIRSHSLWLISNVAFGIALFFTSYTFGMSILHTILISFGVNQWEVAKLLRIRGHMLQQYKKLSPSKTRRSNKYRVPSLIRMLGSKYICANNQGCIWNWRAVIVGEVPRHCFNATKEYPNLDHHLPSSGDTKDSSAVVQESILHSPSDYVGDSSSFRPQWMVFINEKNDCNSCCPSSSGPKSNDMRSLPDVNE
eukprot:CAMPEP_0167763982 /NCGR_PEP_ID=MMETSP0110_2-20121227/13739_1 /TAXON_ID=629695 /ORGANISM="Gymnochlora sp., Strain CCMP2014" /LENGTH=194 /DNA_ID=CAMNT_0007651255 /DNA_START=548 /DNA_END=1129 /DNA_ORIENTATION=-